MKEYKQVPVSEAVAIGDKYDKHAVVIMTLDMEHRRVHATTAGKGTELQNEAHEFGQLFMHIMGGDLSKKKEFQDNREKWLIWSMEHNGWWNWNSRGYTQDRKAAGRYSFDEAKKIVQRANEYCLEAPNEAMILDTYPNDK